MDGVNKEIPLRRDLNTSLRYKDYAEPVFPDRPGNKIVAGSLE
jgi:hypothetical protein